VSNGLRDRLAAQIAQTGPLTVAQYMTACLHDPRDGYYATRPALGETGDFITAPLVSQMFGELIGLWAVETWQRLGAPERFQLVEVGPGDGTLMDDALRSARVVPGFLEACDLILIEPSAPLRAADRANRPRCAAVTNLMDCPIRPAAVRKTAAGGQGCDRVKMPLVPTPCFCRCVTN
jgi:SAM-dependent MidA family methyltransferase